MPRSPPNEADNNNSTDLILPDINSFNFRVNVGMRTAAEANSGVGRGQHKLDIAVRPYLIA